MSYPASATVDVIIGQNYSDILFIQGYRRGNPCEAYTLRTPLGWCFHGPTDLATSNESVTSHFISSKMIEQTLDNKYSVTNNSIEQLTEHILASESEVPNLSQKEQSKCEASMSDQHIQSPKVFPDSPVLPSPPEICTKSHR